MTLHMSECIGCGVFFESRIDGQKYHSKECRLATLAAAKRNKVTGTKICPSCNLEKHKMLFPQYSRVCSECVEQQKQLREERLKSEQIFSSAKKTCDTCGQRKPLSEFARGKSINYRDRQNACRECQKRKNQEYQRVKYQQKREQERQTKRDFLFSLPFRERIEYQRRESFKIYLRVEYGISIARYDALVVEQEGVCAICGNPPEQYTQLYVDHNHETGAVRGLLCSSCNFGLGHFRDNISNLQSAIEYLKKFVWLD